MENSFLQEPLDPQIEILKFMEITDCQSYDQAKNYIEMYHYQLKDAIDAYVSSKENKTTGHSNRSTNTHLHSPSRLVSQGNQAHNIQFSFTPEQALILEQRLRSSSSTRHSLSQNNSSNNSQGLYSRIAKSCRNSFKCFEKLKKTFNKKVNSMKKDDEKIFYFTELYQSELNQAGFQLQGDLIESFELGNVEQNQKMKATKNQSFKPIFAMAVPNRKSPLIVNLLKNREIMQFIRQNFEVILLTLSELKQINLPRNHSLRNIRKCPTTMIYVKNFYDLEDILIKFEGQELKQATLQKLKQSLEQVPNMIKKWNYMLKLEQQLKQHSITSLNQVAHDYFHEDSDQDHFDQGYAQQTSQTEPYDSKKSLIQEQTKIYEEMVAEQNKRKKSIEIEKQRLQELKQLREVRKLSIPEQPSIQQLHQSIQFRFRCPLNGEHITRRFLKDQKVDILYQFVDTNDNIEFEADPQRNFDLFNSFPPSSLSEKKDQLLKDVFDQEKENIVIREV